MQRERALQLIYEAIDTINPQLPSSRRLAKDPATILVGESGVLDSLALINFVLAVEERIADITGASVQLLDDTALITPDSPFHTVATLARHIERHAGTAPS